MIRRLIQRWQDREAHDAARLLANVRKRKEREAIHATARQLCSEIGMKVPAALRG